MTHIVPELLAPAGNLEKLKVALLYGADAVYLGGQKFGLRAASDNFTNNELREAVEFAHARDKKVYVVLNSFFHDEDMLELPPFLELLSELKVDAVIVSDLGVIQEIRERTTIPIHLSTQASCLNIYAAKLWKKMGVSRIVLGREVSLNEAKLIKDETGLELEMFIHGSMCMSYSGNCVISNYTQGRDSNRGGCAHSCRFEYSLSDGESEKDNKSFFMSSKDLNGIDLLPQYREAGIDSVKVEGRMKGHYYVGTVSKIYAEALESLRNQESIEPKQYEYWNSELKKISHREYTKKPLLDEKEFSEAYQGREAEKAEYEVIGVVLEVVGDFKDVADNYILLDVRAKFYLNDMLELLPLEGKFENYQVDYLKNVQDENIEHVSPGHLVKIPYHPRAKQWNLVRRRFLQ